MKLLRSLRLFWTADSDGDEKLLDRSFDQTVDDATVAAEGGPQVMIVAAAAVDAAIPFGPVTTAKRVLIVTDKTITVKLNGGSESFTIKPTLETAAATKSNRGVFYWEGVCTQIQVSNPGTSAANIVYALAGI